MKKILFFVPTFSNLSETFILREIEKIDRNKKLLVEVLALKEGKAEIPENLKGKIYFIPFKFSDLSYALTFFVKNFIHIFRVGIDFFKNSKDSIHRNLINFLKSIVYASKISKFDFNQLHIHFMSDISTIVSLASLILRKPFSISGHARDVFIDGSAISYKVMKAKFITLCNTKAFLKCLELAGGKGRKNVVLAFHGVDESLYSYSKKNFKVTDELNIITDGRFTEKKGLITLSHSIVSLINEYNFKIKFSIIGLAVGEKQQEILENVKDIFKKGKCYEHLNIPGNGKGIQQSEVVKLYQNADIFIYAGIDAKSGDSDGIPNGLIQAAFSGLRVLTTTSGSISDLFNNNNSYILEQNSSESIIEKFNEMMIDKNSFKKSELAHKDVVKNFGLDSNIKYLETLLSK